MMNECVPKYFDLDIPTKRKEKGVLPHSDDMLRLTEQEKDHLKLKRERCFQLILREDLTPQDTARMFTKYGDVSVVKTGKGIYWVEFESLETGKKQSITKVADFFKKNYPKQIEDIKLFDEARRYGNHS